MRRDTLALGIFFVFLFPFSLSIAMGYLIDYEEGCSSNKHCPKGTQCTKGMCRRAEGCGPSPKPMKSLSPASKSPSSSMSPSQAFMEYLRANRRYRQARRRWLRDRSDDGLRDEMRQARREKTRALRRYRVLRRSRFRIRRRYGCPEGSVCNRRGGYCYYPSPRYSTWIYLHPGYYPQRRRIARMRRGMRRTRTRTRRGYRSRSRSSYRGFRGGGLGFGK